MSLYTVQALLILDSEGKRLYAKYFGEPPKEELVFEKQLAEKTNRVNGDILISDQRVVVYKQLSDVILYVVAGQDENEILMYTLLMGLREALEELLENSVDRQAVIEHYDRVALLLDEAVDGGIILETDPKVLTARVTTKAAADEQIVHGLDLSEQGLKNIFSFAKKSVSQVVRNQFA